VYLTYKNINTMNINDDVLSDTSSIDSKWSAKCHDISTISIKDEDTECINLQRLIKQGLLEYENDGWNLIDIYLYHGYLRCLQLIIHLPNFNWKGDWDGDHLLIYDIKDVNEKQFECIKFICDNGYVVQPYELAHIIEDHTHNHELIEYLLSKMKKPRKKKLLYDEDLDSEACDAAAEFADVKLLEKLHKMKLAWGTSTTFAAARSGNIETLQYALENRCPLSQDNMYEGHWDLDCCSVAAAEGHIHVLKYLHQKRCHWHENTCSEASANGKLNCLMFAHENGCPWDIETCYEAARNGHIECLKYAYENGCPWNETVWKAASKHGRIDCVKYCIQNNCPGAKEQAWQMMWKYARLDDPINRMKFWKRNRKYWWSVHVIASAWSRVYWSPNTYIGRKRLERNFKLLTM
jgi:hypothetical protein